MKITPENISRLKKGEVFVFGSNEAGDHAGGAARIAAEKFKAIQGQGIGLMNDKSYAIPTMNRKKRPLALGAIQGYVDQFIEVAIKRADLQFLVTAIGTGIASFTVDQIAPLFKEAINLQNVSLPESFLTILGNSGKRVVTTQGELDAIREDFAGEIVITGGSIFAPIDLARHFAKAQIILSGKALVDLRGNAQVGAMWESSQVRAMWGSSQVGEMWGSSQVGEMRESSQVRAMWGNSTVRCYGSNKIVCYGYNYVFAIRGSDISGITLNSNSQVLYFDTFSTRPDIEFFMGMYPVVENNGLLTLYKAVHKDNYGFHADACSDYRYSLGESKQHDNNPSTAESCTYGLHCGTMEFACNFGRGWKDLAIIEVQAPKDKIVVSKDCNGKVRTSELVVIRELAVEEYQHLI